MQFVYSAFFWPEYWSYQALQLFLVFLVDHSTTALI